MPSTRSGFTIIELAISVALIGVITSIALFSNADFSSKTVLSVRVQEMAEYIRFAQERSNSSEILSGDSQEGYQVVRFTVRNGLLSGFQLEKVPGIDADGAETISNEASSLFRGDNIIAPPSGEKVDLRHSEEYFVDACFIKTSSGTEEFVREYLPVGVSDTNCSSQSMLCVAPNPENPGFSRDRFARNNFDIHFSIKQPTREIYSNIIPFHNNTYAYYAAKPNGSGSVDNNTSGRISDSYTGIRVVFIEPGGLKKSIDIYSTGFITERAKNGSDGCPAT